jgi:hypothetical protein
MKRTEAWIVVLSAALAAPFVLLLPWLALFRLLVELFPGGAPLFLLEVPSYLWFRFLSRMPRYLGYSALALLISLLGAALVFVRLRAQAWRSARLYLPLLAVLAVLAFPFWMRYQPAAEPLPGVALRHVDPPGLLQGVVKQAQVAVEQSEVQYEPLGWSDGQTLVYRLWYGGRYEGERWQPGVVRGLYAYDLGTAEVTPFAGDLQAVSRAFCTRATCVAPCLSSGPLPTFPGHYATTLLSPDGRWAAFTVRHTYGPEDLLVIELPEAVEREVLALKALESQAAYP